MTAAADPWHGEVSVQLIRRRGVDQQEIVLYDSGSFTRRFRVVGGIGPGAIQLLQGDDLKKLRTELRTEIKDAPEGIDPPPLEVAVRLIDEAIRNEPSTRFDRATFGDVERDNDGALIGRLAIGV